MKNIIILLSVFTLISCSKEQSPEELEAFKLGSSLSPIVCEGYGIFENQQYDCGWKRGYTDWVYHYNSVVDGYEYSECYKIRVIQSDGTTISILWNTTHNSVMLIQQTQNQYQSYYNNLFNNTTGDFNQGKIAGYLAGRGQQPYAANDGDNEDVCD